MKPATRPPIHVESKQYFASLGKHIALRRKSQQMTQAELARAVGVSPQAVFAWEIGDRRVSVLVLAKLAKLFASSTDDLIGMATAVRVQKGRISPKAIRHAQRLQALSKTSQRFVIRIIDVLENSDRQGDARS
jgi:transcriptional regulator with XRE-family HTH domain